MFDILIIGAGVIGCSIARELSRYDLKIMVVEKESDVSSGTSKANSGIVHAGFDAKPGTLKAKFNVLGNQMFDKLKEDLDFHFKRNGALVLGFNEEDLQKLNALKAQGEKNGVQGLRIISNDELHKMEPKVSDGAKYALYAPTSGVVSPYEMTIALAENAYTNGVQFKLNEKVTGIEKSGEIFKVKTDKEEIESKIVINCAGVYADDINNAVSENKLHIIPRRGEYMLFDSSFSDVVNSTIFRLPSKLGKGVLVTKTADGNLLIGPNAVDIEDKSDIETTSEGLSDVSKRASESISNIPFNKIITSFSGLRAHENGDDFVIGESKDVKNFINAAGIESPGLSSAPAIAEFIMNIVKDKLNPKENIRFNPRRENIIHFKDMSNEEREKLVKSDPEYGKIICRCELVTLGEIKDAIHRPLGAKTIDAVKKRTRAGMGRCQGGFCMPRVLEILSKELREKPEDITKFGGNSKILLGKNKNI